MEVLPCTLYKKVSVNPACSQMQYEWSAIFLRSFLEDPQIENILECYLKISYCLILLSEGLKGLSCTSGSVMITFNKSSHP
jgi:hypothetical protein